ncbi:MAG: ester cyclase [Gammaproteobacteria bacterium]|jgi:steroid delta-isomerase-like uncharacterized protein
MKTQLLKEFIQRIWNEGDLEAASDYLAPRYTVHHDPGDPWEGKTLDLEGFRRRVRQSRAPVPDQTFRLQEIFENEASVAITWTWQGTHLGEIAGFPATGHPLRMSGATVYYFDGDRISGHWQIADRLGIFSQLRQAAMADGGR